MMYAYPNGLVINLWTLKQARLSTGLTWREFAKEIGVPLSTYRLIERGEQPPTTKHRKAIEDFYRERDMEVVFPNRICEDFSLKGLRKWSGYTQAEVAEKLGVTRLTYSRWEQGKTRPNFEGYWALMDLYHDVLAQNGGRIKEFTYGRL